MDTKKLNEEWSTLKSKIKSKWDKLNDMEIEKFKEKIDTISEKIQQVYGYTKDEAEKHYKDFKESISKSTIKKPIAKNQKSKTKKAKK